MASGRLRLRRGTIVAEEPLTVEVGGERRPAWADVVLLGEMRVGDEVIVNVASLELGLGSGGFDVVHANLTRGLEVARSGSEHVIKLNYSSLQHAIEPLELPLRVMPAERAELTAESIPAAQRIPVVVLPLHAHLAPAAWALQRGERPLRVGYVQTGGGALPGGLSRDVALLRERGLLCGHVTAAPAYGGEQEALSVAGALHAVAERLGWEAALVGPGPGIIGSETSLGHGGMAALDSAHASLALGMRTLLSPRLSDADPRERHRGVSHHTRTVLSLLLAPVEVAVPALQGAPRERLAEACAGRHRLLEAPAEIDAYADSGLPARAMGRSIEDDPLFYAAALAAGAALRGKG